LTIDPPPIIVIPVLDTGIYVLGTNGGGLYKGVDTRLKATAVRHGDCLIRYRALIFQEIFWLIGTFVRSSGKSIGPRNGQILLTAAV
jgi:hypothetical protein